MYKRQVVASAGLLLVDGAHSSGLATTTAPDGLVVAITAVALVAERTKSAELSDHARSRDVFGGGAIGAGVGADDLHGSVAQLTKCVARTFLAGSKFIINALIIKYLRSFPKVKSS